MISRSTSDSSYWADRNEVEASIGSGSVCTINALTREIHAGTSAIHYGRPGHIPKSVNVPFNELMEKGEFLPVPQLREHFTRSGAFEKERVVTYCGGGIAANLAGFVLRQLDHPSVGGLRWLPSASGPQMRRCQSSSGEAQRVTSQGISVHAEFREAGWTRPSWVGLG